MAAFSESAGLFEVNIPDFKQLKACRREVIMLKMLWDMIGLVLSSIHDWKKTLWCVYFIQLFMQCYITIYFY